MFDIKSKLASYKHKIKQQAEDQNIVSKNLNNFLLREFGNFENIIRATRFQDGVFTIQTVHKIYANELFFRRDKIFDLLKSLDIKIKKIVIN